MRFLSLFGALLLWSAGVATGFAVNNSDPGRIEWTVLATMDLLLGMMILARIWIRIGRL